MAFRVHRDAREKVQDPFRDQADSSSASFLELPAPHLIGADRAVLDSTGTRRFLSDEAGDFVWSQDGLP